MERKTLRWRDFVGVNHFFCSGDFEKSNRKKSLRAVRITNPAGLPMYGRSLATPVFDVGAGLSCSIGSKASGRKKNRTNGPVGLSGKGQDGAVLQP